MNISLEELKKEEKHLSETIKTILCIIEEKNVNIENYKKDIVDRKKFLWQNLNEFSDPEMYSTMEEEDLNVSIINKDIKKVYKLYRSKETPYFSRIDFESSKGKETFYIGLTGVDKDYEPIVYDWRAPVANLYYNYGIGNSEYEVGEEKVTGITKLKRQFDIKMGKIESVYDTASSTSDYLLESALSHNTSEQMKNIVGTIQKEQNEIIRLAASRNVIVDGAAGSGKTSVAMHRIAYLLYNQKDLSNQNILIFSPSDIFSNYIANVLPELGEENVYTTTFKDFCECYIKGIQVESLVEFVERYYENPSNANSLEVKKKLSSAYHSDIDKYLDDYYDSLKFSKKIGLKKTFISSMELNDLKSKIPKSLSFHDRIVRLSEKICEKFGISSLDNATRMYDVIVKTLKVETNPVELYADYLKSPIEKINYEDIPGILYLYFEVVGYPCMSHIRLVLVDEAQDYSLWQFELLKKIFNRATFTILGDKNQAINPYLKYEDLCEIQKVFKDATYRRLSNTYRSSKEIIAYSNRILDLEGITSVRPSNAWEVIEKCEKDLESDLKSDITAFKQGGFKHIAVITKTETERQYVYGIVKDLEVEVLPVYAAKGLEYDALIVYTDPNNPYSKEEANLFYVAATRALHALIVYNQKI